MLTTVEAEIDVNGKVELLEPLQVTKRTRAIVTLLNSEGEATSQKGNSKDVLEFLRNNRLPESSRRSVEEIDEYIKELRESWD